MMLASSAAQAREPRTAIAPTTFPPTMTVEMSSVFQSELPNELVKAGFTVRPTNEIDLKIGERPELLQCRSGGCLPEEAAFLNVGQLIVQRLEPAADGGYVVGASLYSAAQKRVIAESIGRCAPCSGDALRKAVHEVAVGLRQKATRPGTLDVTTTPAATLALDSQQMGKTPWSGSVEPGDHVLVVESGSNRVEKDISVAPGDVTRVTLSLVSADAEVTRVPPSWKTIVKWSALGAGVAAVGVGIGMLVIDGRGTCSLAPMQKQCPKVYDTLPLGASLTAIGGALLITSVVVFILDRPAKAPAISLVPTAGGATLSVLGRF